MPLPTTRPAGRVKVDQQRDQRLAALIATIVAVTPASWLDKLSGSVYKALLQSGVVLHAAINLLGRSDGRSRPTPAGSAAASAQPAGSIVAGSTGSPEAVGTYGMQERGHA